MPLNVRSIRIKQSTYLLIPKTIAKMIDLESNTEFELELKKNGNETFILEYKMNDKEKWEAFMLGRETRPTFLIPPILW